MMFNELRSTRERCEAAELENERLYSDMDELRRSAERATAADGYRQQLRECESHAADLQMRVVDLEGELAVKSNQLGTSNAEAEELRGLYKSLQEELKRLQEKSASFATVPYLTNTLIILIYLFYLFFQILSFCGSESLVGLHGLCESSQKWLIMCRVRH